MPAPDPGKPLLRANSEIRGIQMSSENENILQLLGPREVIGQAIEWLIVTHGVSRDEAIEMLVQDSAGEHRTVREIAAAIVRKSSGLDSPSPTAGDNPPRQRPASA